jgi:hypothetical protein
MHPIARKALEKLLDRATRAQVRGRDEVTTLLMSEGTVPEYRALRSVAEKDEVDGDLRRAQSIGAISIEWDVNGREGDFIRRLTLIDSELVAEYLGCQTHRAVMAAAGKVLKPYIRASVGAVLDRWSQLKSVRGRGPDAAQEFADAARVIDYLEERSAGDVLMRVASVAIFGDSKRLEALGPALDALTADGLDAPPRAAGEVFAELGLLRQPAPALMAGSVKIRRERASTKPDRPYSGYPPEAVLGFDDAPGYILVLENLTTFHQVAALIQEVKAIGIYSGGMPSPSWRAMFDRLLASCPQSTVIYHWGDIDEGGFRIAAAVAEIARGRGFRLQPWLMSPEAVRPAGSPVKDAEAARMSKWARRAGWNGIADEIASARITIEQEAVPPVLPS